MLVNSQHDHPVYHFSTVFVVLSYPFDFFFNLQLLAFSTRKFREEIRVIT